MLIIQHHKHVQVKEHTLVDRRQYNSLNQNKLNIFSNSNLTFTKAL